MPGVAFLIGFATPERHAREVVRTSAVGDIGRAVFAAILLHAVALAAAVFLGFNLRGLMRAILLLEEGGSIALRAQVAATWIAKSIVYVILSTLIGFALGIAAARFVVSGWLRTLATHRWVYDVLKFGTDRGGLVTAYVLTTTAENGRALMYKGVLSEFFLTPDGQVAYLMLRNCRRFFMRFDVDHPVTTQNISIFDGAAGEQPTPGWNYLLIQGTSVANVLLERSEAVSAIPRGRAALNRALDDMRHG